jgi:hypothetical protein
VQLSTEPDGGDLKKVLDGILKKDNPVGKVPSLCVEKDNFSKIYQSASQSR